MTLELAWIYEIHHFQLKLCPFIVEVKIIALTYYLATLPILVTKIAITRYLENIRYLMYKYNILIDDWHRPLSYLVRKVDLYDDFFVNIDNKCIANDIINLCRQRDIYLFILFESYTMA